MRYQRGASVPTTAIPNAGRRGLLLAVAACALLVVLAGCAQASARSRGATTPQASATSHRAAPAGTATPSGPTAVAGPTYVQITDLNTFQDQLSAAFAKNDWSVVAQFLSPDFAFQGLDSGGNRMVMPDSAADLSSLYESQGPWTQASVYEVQIHFCDAGNTPVDQQMGFDGNGGSFILVGIERWQGVWLVSWGFQDPLGGGDACA
ncbi:MAG: hypothetical protein ACLQUY_20280 [Ktedonobacterales bacterium]